MIRSVQHYLYHPKIYNQVSKTEECYDQPAKMKGGVEAESVRKTSRESGRHLRRGSMQILAYTTSKQSLGVMIFGGS